MWWHTPVIHQQLWSAVEFCFVFYIFKTMSNESLPHIPIIILYTTVPDTAVRSTNDWNVQNCGSFPFCKLSYLGHYFVRAMESWAMYSDISSNHSEPQWWTPCTREFKNTAKETLLAARNNGTRRLKRMDRNFDLRQGICLPRWGMVIKGKLCTRARARTHTQSQTSVMML